jgi:hypothetical protein
MRRKPGALSRLDDQYWFPLSTFRRRNRVPSRPCRAAHSAAINVSMLTHWQEILPAVIESLNPLHREILIYVMGLPGKRKPADIHAKRTWNMGRAEFDRELEVAFTTMRRYFMRYALSCSTDLDFM